MSAGERIVQSCERWLADGPLGDKLNGDAYRRLISCGFNPAVIGGGDLGTVHTSCAIFVRAILHDSGVLLATKPVRIGQGFWGGYLGVLSPKHCAWIPFSSGLEPPLGAIFYIESPASPNNNHTGFFLERLPSGNRRTAEGGGGDGTRCAFGERTVALLQKGRHLKGWFDPELIASPTHSDPDDEPTKPETPRSLTPVATRRVLIRGMTGADVAEWQEQLRKDGWIIKADGVFGTQTDAATRGWQAARKLEIDGAVGPKTRAAIGTPARHGSGTMPAVKP